MVLALSLAVFISPFASSYPDGLEKVAEEQEFIERAANEEESVWQHSPFPDYGIEKVKHESVSTGLAGFMGTGLVFIIGFIIIRLMRRRTEAESASR
jgi:hypothetical protein